MKGPILVSEGSVPGDMRPTEGQVPRRIFTDPVVYEQELRRIFLPCWLFVCHESELPHPGDYVTREMGEDPVIVVRDEDGQIRVLLNSCRHRGMRVCQVDSGNSAHFRCPYHGWTYRNNGTLTGVPARAKAYGGSLDRSELGLRAARTESYAGLVFACWDDGAESLQEYLGGMTWYLDLLFGRSSRGLEVVGPPHRWVVETNWKIPADNFVGDAYHTIMTHGFLSAIGRAPSDPLRNMHGHAVSVGNGHGLGLIKSPPGETEIPFLGLPEALWDDYRANLSPDQVGVLSNIRNAHGTVFPNLSFLHPAFESGARSGERHVSYLSLRQWQPKSPTQIEAWSWLLVDRDAPQGWKEESRRRYTLQFGPAGTFEQDDAVVWTEVTKAARGVVAKDMNFDYSMGLGGAPGPDDTWLGPGVAFATDYTEANQRAFFEEWRRRMSVDQTEWGP